MGVKKNYKDCEIERECCVKLVKNIKGMFQWVTKAKCYEIYEKNCGDCDIEVECCAR